MANANVRPFVKRRAPLGFATQLKERGLWPPRLHDRKNAAADQRKTATPFLVVPAMPVDIGVRPQPNSIAFHSHGVWIEEVGGTVVSTPVVGGVYRIKGRVRNLGAFPAYGGLADFYVNTPAAFTAAAGTAIVLRSLGHTGFSLLHNDERILECPNLWTPLTPADLDVSIVMHAYDLFSDNLVSRFDARTDRHVGRHDFPLDVYVRDWTDSAAIHDTGSEPSARPLFFVTSDVWNRRSPLPGSFVDDQPQNELPQQSTGSTADNVIFARVSRNDASTTQTVRAHFVFAEFGTGSPFVDCSHAPDPAVTLAPGQLSALVSLPWHLSPVSSPHLCLAVQVYAEGDPYAPPGLTGHTPGWPTTDLMVITDNNKAQRNMTLWNTLPGTGGTLFGIVFNAATFVRDVRLDMEASEGALQRLGNARVSVPLSGLTQELRPGSSLMLKQMLPGERRWVAVSYDRFSAERQEDVSLFFNEHVDDTIVNGFAFTLRADTPANVLRETLRIQGDQFYRLSEGFGVESARAGLALCRRLQERADVKAYFSALPELVDLMTTSVNEMSKRFGGLADPFGTAARLKRLEEGSERELTATLALHNEVLHQLDALQTMAVKSRGDSADLLFTIRLQRSVYGAARLASCFGELLTRTGELIATWPAGPHQIAVYMSFVRSMLGGFERTAGMLASGPVRARYAELDYSLTQTPEAIQRAHLNFLNAVLLTCEAR